MRRVIVLDNLSQDGLDVLAAAEGVEYEVRTGLAGDELKAALAEFDGAICRSGVTITAESLADNRRLRAIARAGVGTDNIDLNAATRQGIVVMNTPGGNTLSTAEHTVALLMALSRNIAPAYQALVEGRWDRKKYMGAQLADKTLGIVGLGRIGQTVAKVARALQMKIIGYDPWLSREFADKLQIEVVESVDDMLPRVDYLTVHTPLTKETKNLISDQQIEIIKPGARLINCARGGIYDEAALLRGLDSGKLAGVALDVFATEPCTDSPLFGHEGVVCTPHLGASTEEAQALVAVEAAQLLVDYFATGAVRHAVNVSPLDPQLLESLRGFLNVAYRLGILVGQMHQHGASDCHLRFRGDVVEKDTRVLTSAFAAGLLEGASEEGVNLVNAEVLLKERGIELSTELRSDMGDFSSALTAQLNGGGKTVTAAGTLFGASMPRLIRLNDYRLEAYLDGVLCVFEHQDVPGIIGAIGTILGQHQVNIAQMAVGRASETPGGAAIGVLNLDGEPSDESLAEVRNHPAIESATVIRLPSAGEVPPWLGAAPS